MGKKETPIPPDLISKFCDLIVEKMGLNFPKEDWEAYEKKLLPVAAAFGFDNVHDCLKWLTKTSLNQEQISILAKYLTIGETYFFRDSNSFKALKESILPELIRQRQGRDQTLRIWCAACCTGEEPYSLAILLHQLIPDIDKWNITILGTDINAEFLQKAEKGIYKLWSFRATPEPVKKAYFIQEEEGKYQIIPEIRNRVKYMYLNLVEDKYPSLLNGTNAMDLILCNNVLIYFSPEGIRQVVKQLTSALVEGGCLLVSAIEVPFINDGRLVPFRFRDATLFRKTKLQTRELYATPPPKPKDYQVEVIQPARPPKSEIIIEAPKTTSKTIPKEAEPIVEDTNTYQDIYNRGLYEELVEKLEPQLSTHKQKHFRHLEARVKMILLLAKAYANLGQMEKAKEWSEKAIQAEKLDPEPYFLHSTILQEMGSLPEAIASIKRALFLDPNFVIGYYILGVLMNRTNKPKEAERNFRNALQLLQKIEPDKVLEGADGMTAGRLLEIITSLIVTDLHKNAVPS